MHISVSPVLCSGHGRCYDVSPEVFHADEEGYCAEQGTEFAVAAGHEEAARQGAAACPEAAITVIKA
jgi:ferredoxin